MANALLCPCFILESEIEAPMEPSPVVSLLVRKLLIPGNAEKAIDSLIAMQLSEKANASARDEFKLTNICENLVEVQGQNLQSTKIQRKVCRLSNELMLNDYSTYFKTAFLDAGVVETTIKAMQAHSNSLLMMQWGCACLHSVIHCSDSGAKQAVKAGGIEAVIMAIYNYPADKYVLEDACGCLWNIARLNDTPSSTLLIEKGAIDAALAAMQFSESEGVQKRAIGFLTSMTKHRQDARDTIRQKGGLVIIGTAEHKFQDNTEIAPMVITLLRIILGKQNIDYTLDKDHLEEEKSAWKKSSDEAEQTSERFSGGILLASRRLFVQG
jgi:hypothetical protein